jgi:LysM repeat protein
VPQPLIEVPEVAPEPAPVFAPLAPRQAPRSRLRTFLIGLSGGTVLLAILAIIAAATIFSPIGARRAGRAAAEQELRGELARDETVVARAYVSQRNWWDNYRESFGLLAATDRRLIFVGAPPASLLRPDDGPPELRVQSFPYDATFSTEAWSLWGKLGGMTVRTLGTKSSFIVAGAEVGNARAIDTLVASVQRARAAERAAERAASAAPVAPPPVYTTHVIRYGEALSTIARRYGTTERVLRELNNLGNDRIRAGYRLRVPAPPDAPEGTQ